MVKCNSIVHRVVSEDTILEKLPGAQFLREVKIFCLWLWERMPANMDFRIRSCQVTVLVQCWLFDVIENPTLSLSL
jgi:hypothetical protein